MSNLSGPEGDDAADRVVGGHADGDAITWNNLDPEAAHAAAQLREHFVARIALHAIEAAGVNGHDSALHINQIVFTQYSSYSRAPERRPGLAISVPQCAAASKSIISNS
jgi:hypothetical protein